MPEPIEASAKNPKLEQYFQFYIKLLRGICYVKNFDLKFLPKGLREATASLPNPDGWRLNTYELLANSVFKNLKPSVAVEQAYCYCLGLLGGVLINFAANNCWSEPSKEDDEILDAFYKPLEQSVPKLTEEQQEKFLMNFYEAIKKKFFDTPHKTIENLAELFRGLHDGILAIPMRGEHIQYDSASSRVHFILLVYDDKIDSMNTVAEMYDFVQSLLKPAINLDPDTFKKICQRIDLQGREYRSMDTLNEPVP
jgi:hypothetical protein